MANRPGGGGTMQLLHGHASNRPYIAEGQSSFLLTFFGLTALFGIQTATHNLVVNKFKNKRRNDTSREVMDNKRQHTGLQNYLPADKEDAGCGLLRYKLRHGMLRGAEVRCKAEVQGLASNPARDTGPIAILP